MKLIDPPHGYMYGFPKPIPDDRLSDIPNFLIENGYPKKLIKYYGDDMPIRFLPDLPLPNVGRGGKREGSGRKAHKTPKKGVTVRVLPEKENELKQFVKELNKK